MDQDSTANGQDTIVAGSLEIDTLLQASQQPQARTHSWCQCLPLVVESDSAFKALLVVPLVIWWLAIAAGVAAYEGMPPGKKRVYHIMLWFDKGILRPAGPLVPFVILAVRSGVLAVAHWWENRHAARPKRSLQLDIGCLTLVCVKVYAAMAAIRVIVYLIHYYAIDANYLTDHMVSDHMFLAATMLICLQAEFMFLLSDIIRTMKAEISVREVGLTLTFIIALFLYLFTAADMFYTAKYYHHPFETFTTTVIVFLLFQLPVLRWLALSRCRQ